MTTTLAVIEAIKTLEESIALPSSVLASYSWMQPVSRVKRAYLVGSSSNQVPNDLPCFMNLVGPVTELRMGNRREDNFTVQVDFFGLPKFDDEAQTLALAYFDAAWDAFDAERPATQRFGGVLAEGYFNLRVEDDVPFNQEPNGPKPCCGFRIFLDVQLLTDVTP